MKKINSIHYGGKIILIGSIVAFGIPGILALINRYLHSKMIDRIQWIVLMIGILILMFSFLYLLIELHQDKKIDQYYTTHRNVKIKIQEGLYECGICGNRKLKEKDAQCMVCGNHLDMYEIKTPQEILNS